MPCFLAIDLFDSLVFRCYLDFKSWSHFIDLFDTECNATVGSAARILVNYR